MKTIKNITLLITMLLCCLQAMAEVEMYIPATTLNACEKHILNVNMRNSEEVTGFQFDIKFPDGIIVNNTINEDGETVPDISLTTRKKSKHQLTCQSQDDGSYRVVVISMSNQTFRDSDGAIVEFNITAKSSMQSGSYPIDLKEIHIVPIINGAPGDRIDQADYTGYINVLNAGQGSDIEVGFRFSTTEINAGGKHEIIGIEMLNNIDVTAFQFDLQLPVGMEVNTYKNEDDELVPDIQLTNRKKSSHTLSCNQREDGLYTVVVMSMKNQSFSGSSGDMVNINVSVPITLIGEYSAMISNIHVVPLVNGNPGVRIDVPDISQAITIKNEGGEAPESDNFLSISPTTLAPGAEGELFVDLTNKDDICSFQFNIKLPQGISVVKEYNEDDEYVEAIYLTDRKKSTHDLSFKQTEDGSYFLIAYSLNNASFKGNSGHLVKLKVKADSSMSNGEYGVVINNAILVTPTEEKIELQGFSGTITIDDDDKVENINGNNIIFTKVGNYLRVSGCENGDRIDMISADGTWNVKSYVDGGECSIQSLPTGVFILVVSRNGRIIKQTKFIN